LENIFSPYYGLSDDSTKRGLIAPPFKDDCMKRVASFLLLLLLLVSGQSGCCHHCYCAPKDLFLSIDRYCFVADWMNDNSCTSCKWSCNNTGPEVCSTHVYTANTDAASKPAASEPSR